MLKNLLKSAVATKAIQIAQREMRKPQNQQRMKDAMAKMRSRGRSAHA